MTDLFPKFVKVILVVFSFLMLNLSGRNDSAV